MRLVEWKHLIDNRAFTETSEFRSVEDDVRDAIAAVHQPVDAGNFTVNPTAKGNGVFPIKQGFTTVLKDRGWELESKARRIDALRTFPDGALPFAVEWETGNISSSHRAVNRMALGMLETT